MASTAIDRAAQVRAYLESVGDALKIPFGSRAENEHDYVAAGSLRVEDWPLLAAVAREWLLTYDRPWPEDDPTVWAPVHAWRALAQLRAADAFDSIASMLDRMDAEDEEFLHEEISEVLGRLGPGVVGPLAQIVADSTRGEWVRVAAADAIQHAAERYPECKERAIAFLTNQIEQYQRGTLVSNSAVVSVLTDLRAVSSAEAIRKAFRQQAVDCNRRGGWEYIREDLGLTPEPDRRLDKADPRIKARQKKKRQRQARKKSRG